MLRKFHPMTAAAIAARVTRRLPSPWFAAPMLFAAMIVASPAITEADCPGIPPLCGMTCSPDAYGTPIYCANGQCTCAPGYDTSSAPGGGLVCVPIHPEAIGTESDEYDCPGMCTSDPWAFVGGVYKAFDLVPVHGIAPGGEAFMPVWGYQATGCGDHGVGGQCSGGTNDGGSCNSSSDCPGGTCALVGACDGGSRDGGICHSAADCTGTCGPKTTGQCQGGINDGHTCHEASQCPGNGAECVPTGFCSGVGGLCTSDADCGGTCQAVGTCSTNGSTCSDETQCPGGTCAPVRSWSGCAPDPFPFCFGLQELDENSFDYPQCKLPPDDGCGHCDDVDCGDWSPSRSSPPGATDACDLCGTCATDFTDARPYLDNSATCSLGTIPNPIHHIGGVSDPARIDFPNNVIVYRAPVRWENFSDFGDNPIDDDYTWNMESPGHELFDTDTEFLYHRNCADQTHGRVHIEFSSDETVDRFADDDWGDANKWWHDLKSTADSTDTDNIVRCYVKSFVNPTLTCPATQDVDQDCGLRDPLAVVAGVPSLDCADDAYQGTDEIHPVLGMAIRIHDPGTDPVGQELPEQWAFFYRQNGSTGPCGNNHYSRCLSDFKLPLGFPVVPDGTVLTGAQVHVDWHPWADKFIGDPSPDITVDESTDLSIDDDGFDLTNGTVLRIHLPHKEDGVVGLVTITPTVDTTAPTITCPGNTTQSVDLGKCTAAVTFAPTFSDDCSVTATCSPPSGSAFPIGTTMDTCTATDQAGLPASCSFNVTVTAGNKCPHDQGYWKTHSNLWPVSSLTLGTSTVPYSKTQLLGILKDSTNGDASLILAKAEIATLLSLANGSNPSPICGTIADANAALGGSAVPETVGPKTVLGQRMVGDASTLTSYNSGNLTPVCTP